MDILINIVLFGLVAWFLFTRFAPVKGMKQITTTDLRGVLKSTSSQLIDVRTQSEFKANHIKRFKNIPLDEVEARLHELSKDREVIVICQSGMRSNKASKLLIKHGFTKVTNVKGGMSAW
ncbi:rhodanese-like domain-containing protein [Bacillus solimangrovi]|uniref:Rhodanese domain-containing protein n=1 Tax=Bacillus solimangrovi TaxID=1305675 RepID=A0A1E5LEP8_9BACI|nr:rhodanese-like domain-containing protein [Bacillus solimangrovi]OEH92549.1 hypothetical protein BFG57_15160 [Bacillus solimangrovi]